MIVKLAALGNAMAVLAVLIAPAAYAVPPDPLQSYFVPQSGPVTTPTEGAAAIAFAIRCPDNDGAQVLKNASRLMVVARASDGSPIPGIAASDICVLFNGGTQAQGFSGMGDDSIIANFQYNQLAHCPDVRCVQADGPTDDSGTTYITWIGHAASDPPGVVTDQFLSRDPLRLWGGYAGDIPVMVLGVQLQGRLTATLPYPLAPLGTYTAHVKSFDHVAGRTTAPNQGELVNSLNINPVQAAIGTPDKYQLDFNNDGIVNSIDLNFIKPHNLHRCNNPR